MAELRWHPLIKDWVMIASHRQNRPQMPKDWCPFCPGNGNVPDDFLVYKYDNDFPSLSFDPPDPDLIKTDFYKTAPCFGKCEVILYSKEHNASLPDLSNDHMAHLVDLWCERFNEIRKFKRVKYIFIFENRGEVVGVTMPHPHGQIYAYPFIPKKIELEVTSAIEYKQNTGKCIFCDMLADEQKYGERIIFENQYFSVFLPFFTEYPYGVYIFPKSHKKYISDFSLNERYELGLTIKETVGMLDNLFDKPFPYMMCMHNAPLNHANQSSDFHFHIEFFPPMRSADKQKYNASSETGVWAHCNPTCPEETAQQLRESLFKYRKKATK